MKRNGWVDIVLIFVLNLRSNMIFLVICAVISVIVGIFDLHYIFSWYCYITS